jgi:TadE-like protein
VATTVRDERGQAAAELVAVVPILLIVVLAVAQLGIAGYALWSAGDAARAAARAGLVGGDPERAARSVLPGWLEDGAEVEAGDGVEVSVRAPALLPGVPSIPLHAATALDPEGGGGG